MEGIIEEHVAADIMKYQDKKYGEKPPEIPVPKDKYFFCHLVFFLLGVSHFLPMTFFSAANNFWLHKFRNTTAIDDSSAENRTFLQANFASFSMVANTVPCLVMGIFNIAFSHRFNIMRRILLCLTIESVIFVLITISSKVNTDDYQVLYFLLVIACYITLAGANTVNIVAQMSLYPRFPHEYMSTTLIGEGSAGIVGDILNIVSVWIFSDDITNATLLYFIIGTVSMTLTLILTIILTKTDFLNHHLDQMPQDAKKAMPSKKVLKSILYKVRYSILILVIFVISMSASHTAVTALVVSESHGSDSSWAANYFSPVMTFLLSDICMLLGRIATSIFPFTKMPPSLFSFFATARAVILLPCLWFCNAQPRKHLSVLFPHDYQYGLILGLFQFTNGIIINMAILTIPGKVENHEADIAYNVFGLMSNVAQTLSSPIGLFIVNIL